MTGSFARSSGYDAMRAVELGLLAQMLLPAGRVLDLGGGTGALAAGRGEKFPGRRSKSGTRIRRCSWWCELRGLRRSGKLRRALLLGGPLPTCDAVVACIALHHVKDLTAKGKIYANIHQAR